MANQNKPRLSLKGEANVQTTEPIAQPPAAPNAPSQETTMEASTLTNGDQAPAPTEPTLPEVKEEPTAKQMAAAEEENAARAQRIINAQQERLSREREADDRPTLIGLAAQGRDALLEGLRKHAEDNKPLEYVPPPRTARQMSQLEAELEAGRKTQERAAEQQASRPVPAKDVSEGFTTPVHRPGDLVPDPTKPAIGGAVAGNRQFGTDAP